MAKQRIYYLCALMGCFGFYIAYREWLSWLLLLCLLGLPVLSLLLSLPLMLTTRVRVTGHGQAEMGTEAHVALAGHSQFLVLPYTGKIKLLRPNTGQVRTGRDSLALPTEHCGGYLATAEKVRITDALGLFNLPFSMKETGRIVIRPRPVPMAVLPELERILARAWKPKPGGGYAENHDLRLYRPGDSLNRIHWKLSAKTGSLMFRQAMEPLQGLVLVTFRLQGSPAELDRKFGRLVWLGRYLLDREIRFELRALTADGLLTFPIGTEEDLWNAVDDLLCRREAPRDAAFLHGCGALWHCHIGGQPDEA
jgi:uncharacterized protein (DUF58 family)